MVHTSRGCWGSTCTLGGKDHDGHHCECPRTFEELDIIFNPPKVLE